MAVLGIVLFLLVMYSSATWLILSSRDTAARASFDSSSYYLHEITKQKIRQLDIHSGDDADTLLAKAEQLQESDLTSDVITKDGTYLVRGDGEGKENTIFEVLQRPDVSILSGSLDTMRDNLKQNRFGMISYTVGNLRCDTFYAPLEETGWYLTTTTHQDVLGRQMERVRFLMVKNSLIQLGVALVCMIAFLGIYLTMSRRTGLIDIEKIQEEEGNRVKSDFLANMSHDVRTPMNAIIGFTNLAIQSGDDLDKIHDYLSKIRSSNEHLLTIINDVLEMSRIESGKIELEESECNLTDLLRQLNMLVIEQVRSKQQDLLIDAVNIRDEDVYCDGMRFSQVLVNLVSNAIKFTPDNGKIIVRISQGEDAPEGYGAYEIHVKDNGIGMSEEFATRIFEPFERERTSTISGLQGTGLGMAITKNIIDLMHGTIEMHTVKGKGTEFILHINLRLQTGQKTFEPLKQLDGASALIVDDDFNVCDVIARILARHGMHVEWTMYGQEAVERTRQALSHNNPFDLYIIDRNLPDSGSMDVAKQIRNLTAEKPPMIMMTSYDCAKIKEEAAAFGVNGFVNKPVFAEDLDDTLLRILENRAMPDDEPVLQKTDEPVDFNGKRILLVDDNELNREIAISILEMHGFVLEEAVDGQDAIDKLTASGHGYFDVVLMDVQMPVMNGYEATKAIRALPDTPLAQIPIIAMTANAFEEDKRDALEAGMNGHIAKPIDVDILLDTLGKILK